MAQEELDSRVDEEAEAIRSQLSSKYGQEVVFSNGAMRKLRRIVKRQLRRERREKVKSIKHGDLYE